MTDLLSTTDQIIHDILVRAGESKDDETDTTYELYDSVLDWINRAYRFICNARQDWPWLRKSSPGTLTFLPAITTGTVSVTNNSTTITFSTAPSSSSVAGWFFRPANSQDVFRVATHTGASTSATLDSVYTGTTASTATYTLFKLEYALASDVVRVVDPLTITRTSLTSRLPGEMTCISVASMHRDYPLLYTQSGTPSAYCYTGETTIRINMYPSSMTRAEYEYHYRPADLTAGSTPILPVERRVLLADFALAMLLDTLSDDRADRWLALANKNIENFINEYDYRQMRQSPYMLRIFPRNTGRKTRTWSLGTYS